MLGRGVLGDCSLRFLGSLLGCLGKIGLVFVGKRKVKLGLGNSLMVVKIFIICY